MAASILKLTFTPPGFSDNASDQSMFVKSDNEKVKVLSESENFLIMDSDCPSEEVTVILK